MYYFYWEGSAKTHIYIDICMRVNIKIPATIITDASSCSFPLVILQEMDGQMERGLLLVCPMEHHGILSPLKGPLASHSVWFVSRLQFNYKLVLKTNIKTWFQESMFFLSQGSLDKLFYLISRPLFRQNSANSTPKEKYNLHYGLTGRWPYCI